MVFITQVVTAIHNIVWGPVMLVLILGVGIFLTIGLRLIPLRKLRYGFRLLFATDKHKKDGDIPAFQALMTALSATVGTGNIAGVATAIFLGGPGALFWMWCTALVGMATKYSEAVLAVKYRDVNQEGSYVGGPMYYIKKGLGPRWVWLAALFALFGSIAGFGIGNTVQANSVANVLHNAFGIPVWITGLVLMGLVAAVLIGGIKRIGAVAAALVPFMTISYLIASLVVLIINSSAIPDAFALIFTHAFSPIAAQGGFAGAAVSMAIRLGVARGVFSNEAGLGSAPIAHAAAKTNEPVQQGLIAMLGTFIDTIIICTLTGLVIVTSGLWTSGVSGAALTSNAFSAALPGAGQVIVAIALAIFAFTTMLGWSYYGERCVTYLFGIRWVTAYRLLWIIMVPVGATMSLNFVWLVADTLNAMMAIPNLIALTLLGPVVFHVTRAYFKKASSNKPE
ncbi:MAG: sodium:alanine symporter family protein [Endozoicomonas sp. (ex Botrylloides leachii)]|nr:sodium:alanine symporter family protein [Endozoicomonas sp. (ex Botrylloides leachii)]